MQSQSKDYFAANHGACVYVFHVCVGETGPWSFRTANELTHDRLVMTISCCFVISEAMPDSTPGIINVLGILQDANQFYLFPSSEDSVPVP